MKIRAADLELFSAINGGGSISRGAAALGLNQSTTSRRLCELESRLGAALFVRSRDGVHLTALGTRWLSPAAAVERQLADAEHALLEHTGTSLNVEVTITTLHMVADQALVPALPALFKDHPQLRVRLLLGSTVMDLARLEADIAIRLVRPESGDLIVRRLRVDRMVATASVSLAKHLKNAPPARWPWVNIRPAKLQPPPVRAWQDSHAIVPRLVVSSGSTHIAALHAGIAVGWMPESLQQSNGLLAMPSAGLPAFDSILWMTTHRAQRQLPHIDAVWQWLSHAFSEL